MAITRTAPGACFIEALASRDLDRARELLHVDVSLAALMPEKSVDKSASGER